MTKKAIISAEAVASAMKDLETSIREVAVMARIATNCLESMLERDSTDQPVRGGRRIIISDEHSEEAIFAAHGVADMAAALQRRFYAAYQGVEQP